MGYSVHMLAWWAKAGTLAVGASSLAVASGMEQQQLGWGQSTPVAAPGAATNSLSAAIAQWKSLQQSDNYPFDSYATFLLAHQGWPGEAGLRRAAEKALDRSGWSPSLAAAYFNRFPPLSNPGKVRYAQALLALGQSTQANNAARAAWIAGAQSPADEAVLLTSFPGALTPEDHDQRMDMLLWQGATSAAQRQLALVSPANRAVFAARLAFRTKSPDATSLAAAAASAGATDPGYIADDAHWMVDTGNWIGARTMLAQRAALSSLPGNPEKWYEVLLTNARGAANDGQYQTAYDIARRVDDAYPPGTDISTKSYGERDDYTSLVWLAGQTALNKLHRPADAMMLFERYGRGSKTPTTRSKGLYWAGRAAQAAGQTAQANTYSQEAAGYRDLFYGQLALERLGQPLTPPAAPPARQIDPTARAAFYNGEVVRAAQYLGTTGDREDQTAFVRQIAIAATTDDDHALAAELSRTLGRPDLGVMIGRSALQNGLTDYTSVGFPTVAVPASANDDWVIVHAIARQESQFDRGAVSRVGARGLMQLMPGTARGQSAKLGLSYNQDALTSDTDYNIELGSDYFQHIYTLYGSYPLAIAAYNAGPGNVNKWLAANGDPRTGAVDMVDWIEAIPFSETKNYVQRVLENAVVYDLMNPQHARSHGTAPLSWYLGRTHAG
jgi:soluble lytic murein transglycosylase